MAGSQRERDGTLDAAPARLLDEIEELRMKPSDERLIAGAIEINKSFYKARKRRREPRLPHQDGSAPSGSQLYLFNQGSLWFRDDDFRA